eukprot:GHVU01228139.1.p3 GENE.GHVU01228139.1~~GHVU01228139.1.p3  ORF type:complete len:110 (-),score=6.03 GHVU01228139.1:1293-1622(-)
MGREGLSVETEGMYKGVSERRWFAEKRSSCRPSLSPSLHSVSCLPHILYTAYDVDHRCLGKMVRLLGSERAHFERVRWAAAKPRVAADSDSGANAVNDSPKRVSPRSWT